MGQSRKRELVYYHERRTKKLSLLRELSMWLLITAASLFMAGFFVLFFGYRTSTLGPSMEETLQSGQEVLVDRLTVKFISLKKGNVIAFYPGGNTAAHPYIKRIVGTPGDVIQILDGVLLVNGVPDADSSSYDRMEEAGIAASPVVLQNGEYFVLGDNRNNSEDSRSSGLGVIKESMIIGKVWLSLPAEEKGFSLVK